MESVRDKIFVNPSVSNVSKGDMIYENCQFRGIVMSDIRLKTVTFINCTFDHIILEASFLEDLLLKDCYIKSLRIRGNRKITHRKLFSRDKVGSIKGLYVSDDNKIDEVTLCGNLKIENCRFPSSKNYIHVIAPFRVYNECASFIEKKWDNGKRKLGLMHIKNFFLAKEIEFQNEDFITYMRNEHLDDFTNSVIQEVFFLVNVINGSPHNGS